METLASMAKTRKHSIKLVTITVFVMKNKKKELRVQMDQGKRGKKEHATIN